MPMYQGGNRIQAAYANSGEEQCPAVVDGVEVYSCGDDLPTLTAYRHFRINVSDTNHSQYLAIQELEFASFTSGGDFTTPGMTTTSSSEFDGSFLDENVIINDHENALGWHSVDSSPAPITGFVAVDTGGSHVLAEVRMWPLNLGAGPDRAPIEFTIDGSNDGSTWDVLSTESIPPGDWTLGDRKVFPIEPVPPPTPVAYRYFKLDIKTNHIGSYVNINDIEMATTPAGADITSPGMTCLASTEFSVDHLAGNAINNLTGVAAGNLWATENVPRPAWWSVDTGGSHILSEIRILNQNDPSGGTFGIRDFDFQGSNDGVNWTTIKAFTALNWSQGVVKTFVI